VPPPLDVPTIQEQVADWAPWYPFWNNFEYRPFDWVPHDERAAVAPLPPRYDAWFKYLPVARFDDPFVDAGRVLLLADIAGWPAAAQAIPPGEEGRFIAPNLDLAVVFHPPLDVGEYLLLRAEAPRAVGGFVGASGTVWSDDFRLLASTVQQMMCRPASPLPG
jgi:acyl-CoA thioesterase